MKKIFPYSSREWLPALLSVFLVLLCMQLVPGFNAAGIYVNILKQSSFVGMMAAGALCVFVTGEVDLSIGAQFGFYGMLMAFLLKKLHWPLFPSFFFTVLMAAALGASLGYCVHKIHNKMPLVSITAAIMLQGGMYILGRGRPIFNMPAAYEKWANLQLGGVSIAAWAMLVMGLLSAFLLHRSYWGKYMYAVGMDSYASEKSGISVCKTKVVAFAISAVFSAVAAVFYLGRIGSTSLSAGSETTIDILTTAALAGVGFGGGYGKVFPVQMGAIFIGILSAAFIGLNLAPYFQTIIKGAILFFALLSHNSKS